MSGSENNSLYCSFVGVQYLICECGDAFQSEEDLRIHLEQKHPKKQKYNVKHLRKVPPPITEYKCGECGQIYPTEEECVAHQEIDHIPYMKEEVIYQDDEEEEEEEQDSESIIVPEEYIPMPTSRPQRKFRASDLMEQPIRVQSLPNTSPRAPPERKYKKRRVYQHKNVQCETCGKKYASNAALRYHQRVHTGVKPYQCSFCPKAFTMSLFLQIHTRTHTGEKPYKCPICPKAFSNRAALLRHDRVHTGVKPYQCPKCGKCFTQSNSMKLHFHTVHLKMPAPYKSRRRQAEGAARERRPRPAGGDAGQSSAAPAEVYYEIHTPAGRRITLAAGGLGRRRTQQLQPLPDLTEEPVPEPEVQPEMESEAHLEIKPEIKGELLYFDVKPEMIEGASEEVAYEIIYE